MKTQSTPTLAAVDQPRLVRVYQFEMWNRNGGHIGPIRAIAPNMKEARSIVKAAAPAWIIRNGKRLPDCYANPTGRESEASLDPNCSEQ